jgi:hypothetical protein
VRNTACAQPRVGDGSRLTGTRLASAELGEPLRPCQTVAASRYATDESRMRSDHDHWGPVEEDDQLGCICPCWLPFENLLTSARGPSPSEVVQPPSARIMSTRNVHSHRDARWSARDFDEP